MADHQFLQIDRYHLNARAAEAYLVVVLREILPRPQKGRRWTSKSLRGHTFTMGKRKDVPYRELLEEARTKGTVHALRGQQNAKDPFFPLFLSSMATTSKGMEIKMSYAGASKKFVGPTRVSAIETDLTDDILEFRRQACAHSGEDGFQQTARYHRAYVYACTSLVEAFLNRTVRYWEHLREHIDVVDTLCKPMAFEERLELWLGTFTAGTTFADIKKTAAWNHHKELRHLRNGFIHATEPLLGFSVKQFERDLNHVREGVGGLLLKLRKAQGLPPTSFAETLATAPRVHFRPRA